MKLHEYIDDLAGRFEHGDLCFAHGTDNPRDEACYLVLESLSLNWNDSQALLERTLSPEELKVLEERVRQRLEGRVPTAYLVGAAWFAGYRFKADERALIPRSPIAELIQNRFEPLLPREPRQALDLCCGGGCIGLAMAMEFPGLQVELADISAAALDLAGENRDLYGLQSRVRLIQSDLFDSLAGRDYDLIVSNPPYVGKEEVNDLPGEFLHEPGLGLLSGEQGLELPRRILAQAADYLSEQGIMILEVGYSDAALMQRYPDIPFLWLEFEHGGQGVLMLTREQLLKYRERFI